MNGSTSIMAYKAFNADWTCRGFQYAVGQTYTHEGKVDICHAGFHACKNPLETFQHYTPTGKFAAVELSGSISQSNDGDTKVASAEIHIKVELSLHDFIGRAVAWLMDNAKEKVNHATGDRSAASSTGDRSAASATGDQSAASATGYQSAASATGDQSAASADHKGASAFGAGWKSKVSGVDGSALHLNEWSEDGREIIGVWAGIVGRNGVKEGQIYTLTNGILTEVAA